MSEVTGIEWTNSTWTPIRARVKQDAEAIAKQKGYTSLIQIAKKMAGRVGPHCERCSDGCDYCYSETNNGRCLPSNGTGLPFDRRSRDLVNIFVDEKILTQPLRWRSPRRIFVCSQTDLFGEFFTDEMIDRVFAVMALCPQHTFQVLTKRADRMRAYISGRKSGCLAHRIPDLIGPTISTDDDVARWCEDIGVSRKERDRRRDIINDNGGFYFPNYWPLPNVWLGVSVENQEAANKRIPLLLQTPAAVRFISAEPLLGPVDLTRIDYRDLRRSSLVDFAKWCARKDGEDIEAAAKKAAESIPEHLDDPSDTPVLNVMTGEWFDGWDSGTDSQKIDWVVAGAESGPGARLMYLDWVRSIKNQCVAAGIPFFFKQDAMNGRKIPTPELDGQRWMQFPERAAQGREGVDAAI